MKKRFIEPEIKRIELNLNENIASSEQIYEDQVAFLTVSHGVLGCIEKTQGFDIVHTDIDTREEWDLVFPCSPYGKVEGARLRGIKY